MTLTCVANAFDNTPRILVLSRYASLFHTFSTNDHIILVPLITISRFAALCYLSKINGPNVIVFSILKFIAPKGFVLTLQVKEQYYCQESLGEFRRRGQRTDESITNDQLIKIKIEFRRPT